MKSNTIEEVIHRLEKIVGDALQNGDRLGIFAQLYLGVTRRVKEGIAAGQFENGERMERLDVLFANRYLDAYDAYLKNGQLSQSWKTAFDAAKKNKLLILQHLFMGMNAHINLDLGIAAFQTVSPLELEGLKNDFLEINNILINGIETVQGKLNRISPLLFLLDFFGKKSDEHLMEFSLKKSRAHAWKVAQRLAKTSSVIDRQKQVKELDGYVAVLNKLITQPGIVGGALVRLVKWFETKNVRVVVEALEW
ncbi:MAG TPA: hypothetical protein ENJ95_06250 [Bacteroidetes bacterium]|nr:hypothetical protein [Bacteroidota bacterium]